jgi:hypothetical protein
MQTIDYLLIFLILQTIALTLVVAYLAYKESKRPQPVIRKRKIKTPIVL